jgi:hypothetical protein
MRGGEHAVRRQDQLGTGAADFLDQLVQRLDAHRVRVHVADIDHPYRLRMAPHDLGIDLRVLLAAVADQHELHAGIETQDQFDLLRACGCRAC